MVRAREKEGYKARGRRRQGLEGMPLE